MMLNRDLESVFEQQGISKQDGYAFCLLFYFGLQSYLLEKGLVDREKTIGLIQLNEEGVYVLKYPVFEADNNTPFKAFIENLMATGKMSSRGHVNNERDSAVISQDKATQEAFVRVTEGIKEFNMEVAVRVTVQYYRGTTFALKLSNFFEKAFLIEYNREL